MEINLHLAEVSDLELNSQLLSDRVGKFTASSFDRLMTYENKIDELPAGAETLVLEKVAETMTGQCEMDDIFSPYMEWGKDHELLAIEQFELATGIKAKHTGANQQLIDYNGDIEILRGHVGGTPDGIIDDETGIEVKCPKSKTHLEYLLTVSPETMKQAQKKYYWQMQGYMMLTGKKAWWFISYDPRFADEKNRLLYCKIERNETDIQRLLIRLEMAVKRKNEILSQLTK